MIIVVDHFSPLYTEQVSYATNLALFIYILQPDDKSLTYNVL